MAKVSSNYECVVIIDPAKGEEGIASISEKFKALIESNGTLDEVTVWGSRRLAYAINDLTEGYYVLYTFSSQPISRLSWTVFSE